MAHTCVEVFDRDGDGGRDLILSSRAPCLDGRAVLRRQIGARADGTPDLGPEEAIHGARG